VSHVSSYATSIVFQHVAAGGSLEADPAWEVLRQAVQAVAEAHGGRTDATVSDVFGRPVRCDIGLHLPEFRAGIGLRVDRRTGQLQFLYDAYGKHPAAIQALTDEIVQNHASLAVAQALRSLNYQVDLEESGNGADRRVVVRGVL
jgi:hypothetical protein